MQVAINQLSVKMRSELLCKEEYMLCQQYLRGNRKAGDILFNHHYTLLTKKVKMITFRSVLNEQDKEDLIQNVMLKVLTCLRSYNGRYRFWTWMKQIMKHEFFRMLKRKYRVHSIIVNEGLIANDLLVDIKK